MIDTLCVTSNLMIFLQTIAIPEKILISHKLLLMLITTGWGILVPVFGFLFPFLMRMASKSLTGSHDFYNTNTYLFYFSLFAAAAVCYIIGKSANQRFAQRNPENPDAGWGQKAFRAVRKHTLFFIPMEYWAFLIPVIGYFAKTQLGIY